MEKGDNVMNEYGIENSNNNTNNAEDRDQSAGTYNYGYNYTQPSQQGGQTGYYSQPQQSYSQTTGQSYAGQTYTGQTYGQQTYGQNVYAQPAKAAKSKKKNTFMPKLLGAVAIGLSFGVFAGFGFYAVNSVTGGTTTAVVEDKEVESLKSELEKLKLQLAGQNDTGVTTMQSGTNAVTMVTSDVTSVVKKVMPSMVSINNLYEVSGYYFGRQYTTENTASGSGIIIGENDTEYLIVTNYHVIEDNKELTVQFTDESEAKAAVKGYEESMDIAVISVQKSDLSASTLAAIDIAEIGDSDALVIGEPAIAIGNALGYGQSVTTGVISALNRNLDQENTYDALIQTSAAINPGNSGGALLNINGQVIGINSNKIGGDTIEGMGYAIPVNAVKDIIDELSNRETRYKVEESSRGYLGIKGATVDSNTSQVYGIPEGVYVTMVYEGSAAEDAGIIAGDVITRIDGQSVKALEELQGLLEYYSGGDSLKVTLLRAGSSGYEEKEVTVTLSYKSIFN